MAKICARCGAPLKFWSNACRACGASSNRPGSSSKGRLSHYRIWILAGSGVLIFAVTTGLFLLGDKPSAPEWPHPAPLIPPTVRHIEPLPSSVPQHSAPAPSTPQPQPLEDRPVTQKLSLPSEGKKRNLQDDSEQATRDGLNAAWAGKLEEAARLFEKAVRANPENVTALNNLGLAKRKQGRLDEAIKAYRRALEIDPSFAVVYKNLGIALEQKGNAEEAVKAYRKYAELNPTAPDLKLVQETIVRLKPSH